MIKIWDIINPRPIYMAWLKDNPVVILVVTILNSILWLNISCSINYSKFTKPIINLNNNIISIHYIIKRCIPLTLDIVSYQNDWPNKTCKSWFSSQNLFRISEISSKRDIYDITCWLISDSFIFNQCSIEEAFVK